MRQQRIFDHLITQLIAILDDGQVREPTNFSKLLLDVNALNYGLPLFNNPSKVLLFIHQCCRYIPPEDGYLAPKCAEFIHNVFRSSPSLKFSFTSREPTPCMALKWCLEVAKLSDKRETAVKAIKAVEGIIRDNMQGIPICDRQEVWKALGPLCQPQNSDDEILYRCVKCLEACTVTSNPNLYSCNELLPCYQVFVNLLSSPIYTRRTEMAIKVLERCLIGLKNIIFLDNEYINRDPGLLLGFVKTYMVFGMEGVAFMKPERLVAAPLSISLPPSKRNVIKVKPKKEVKGGWVDEKSKQKRRPENKPEVFDVASSSYIPASTALSNNSVETTTLQNPWTDSDCSDTDTEKLALACQKVQQAALNLLAEVSKRSDKALLFTYWTSFIPEKLGLSHHHLITCCLNQSSYRTVMCALNALLNLLLHSKSYLHEAKLSEKPSASFTPFSTVLGLTLIELHKTLCLITKQNQVSVLTQVLKCISALVQATPYHQMPKGLITKVVRNVKPLVFHRDPSVQVTALVVMGCLLVVDPATPEIEQCLSKLESTEGVSVKAPKPPKPSSTIFDFAHFSSSEDEDDVVVKVESMPWLLSLCLTNLGVSSTVPAKKIVAPVQLECLQILSAMSRNYLDSMMLPYLEPVTAALEKAFCDQFDQIMLYSARTANFLANAMMKQSNNLNQSAFLRFWQSLLNGPLVKLAQNENYPTVRAVGCDCLSNIGGRLFQQLPVHKQVLCVTLLLTCAKDEDSTVRGAAVRALSLYVEYPAMRADSGFVMDTAEAILTNLKDDNQCVRTKVSWALATLTDALVSAQSDRSEPLPHVLYLRFLRAGVEGAADIDQVCTNAVRVLGNVLQLLDDEMLDKDEFQSVTLDALKSLEKACTSGKKVKARWNACYALASAMKNPRLFRDSLATWQQTALPKLADTAVNFNNFKVRIGAVQALTTPARREFYGSQFGMVWISLLHSLEKSQVVEAVDEYNRRDQLQEQICLGIGRLTALLIREDLPQIDLHLARYVEMLKTQMRRVADVLVPEKSTELFNAASHLEKLRAQCRGACEKRAVDVLAAIFACQC